MWFTFQNIEEKKNMPSRTGKTFDGYVVTGIKKGFDGAEDTEYTKVIFDTQVITVIEKGVTRRGQSLVQFLQKACKPGDTLVIKSERDGKFWRWASIENRAEAKPSYTPLSETEAEYLREKQESSFPSDAQPWNAPAEESSSVEERPF